MLSRRGLITGLISLVAAPAIVHAGNIMPVRGLHEPIFDSLKYNALLEPNSRQWSSEALRQLNEYIRTWQLKPVHIYWIPTQTMHYIPENEPTANPTEVNPCNVVIL